jgi:hypothetical protein
MKTLILMSLAAITISGTAHARGEHCRSLDNSCQQNYRKADAFKVLLDYEGYAPDANSDLRVVEQAVQQYRIGFEPAMGNFLYLFNKLGGASQTPTIQSTFTNLLKYTGSYVSLAEVVDAFIAIYDAEGYVPDANSGLATVFDLTKKSRVRLNDSLNLYLDVFHLVGGASQTPVVQSTFNTISSYANEFRIYELLETYKDLYEAEGYVPDATSNLHLIIKGARKCGSLQEAKEEFLSLFRSLGGASQTPNVQAQYKSLFGL